MSFDQRLAKKKQNHFDVEDSGLGLSEISRSWSLIKFDRLKEFEWRQIQISNRSNYFLVLSKLAGTRGDQLKANHACKDYMSDEKAYERWETISSQHYKYEF